LGDLLVRPPRLRLDAAPTEIGLPLSSDYSISEVADQLGETVKWIDARLESLRRELVGPSILTGCARVVGKSTQNTRPTDTGIELGSSLRASP